MIFLTKYAATLPIFNLYVFSFSPNGLTLLSWLSLDSLLLPASHTASQVSVAASLALPRHCQTSLVPTGGISVHPVLIQMVPNLLFHSFFSP